MENKRGVINVKRLSIIFIIGLALASLGILVVKYLPQIESLSNCNGVEGMLNNYETSAQYIYFLVSFFQPIILPIPEPVTVMAGCSVLGSFKGAIIGCSGTVLGIFTMYMISKYAGRKIIRKLIDINKLDKFNEYVEKNGSWIILILFIFPVLPDEVICAGSGLSNFNKYKFILVAIIGKLITQFSLAYSIQMIKVDLRSCILVILVVTVALFVRFRLNKESK